MDPEKVAYWYFRLNGYFTIENFIVHPPKGGGQRTDADLLAVRFPHRAERLIDDPNQIMEDDRGVLAFSPEEIDFRIVEVKTNQACTLNGPWTNQERQNVERVLAAIGCLASDRIGQAARAIYETGAYRDARRLCIHLAAVGRDRSPELADRFPHVTQLVWAEMLGFIWRRFDTFARQKAQVDQWDPDGRVLKQLASRECEADFVRSALAMMGVRP